MIRGREPFLLGTIGAVIGIVLAVVIFGGLGGNGNAGASASATTATTLPTQSVAPSPTLLAVETVAPTVEITAPPVTAAPTAAPPTAAPVKTPKPTATPNTNPRIISFEAPQFEDCTNSTAGSVHLKWSVRNATGVTISIDGPGIYNTYPGLTREEDLPFGCSHAVLQHSYTITTVGGTGPAASITKIIKTRPASIVSFAMGPNGVAQCATSSGVAGIDLNFEVRAATGAELYRDGGLYSTYNAKVVNTTGIMYDCSEAEQTFKLVTTGGYGPAASKSITVTRVLP